MAGMARSVKPAGGGGGGGKGGGNDPDAKQRGLLKRTGPSKKIDTSRGCCAETAETEERPS